MSLDTKKLNIGDIFCHVLSWVSTAHISTYLWVKYHISQSDNKDRQTDYMKNYYEILGLQKSVTFAEIKKSYRVLASKYHPDKYPENTKFAEDLMKQINIAYGILSDPEKRKSYDEWLDEQPSNPNSENGVANSKGSNSKNSRSESSVLESFRKPYRWGFIFFGVFVVSLIKNCPQSTKNESRLGIKAESISSTENSFSKRSYSRVEGQEEDEKPIKIKIPENFLESATIKVIDNPRDDFRIFVKSQNYKFDLKYREKVWQLSAGGMEVQSDDHLNKVYEIVKNNIAGYYIIQTQCSGNACSGSTYYLLDLEHQTHSLVPIDGNDISLSIKNGKLYATGAMGVDELGDPSIRNYVYYPTTSESWSNGYWLNTVMKQNYVPAIGKHPDYFFSSESLRRPLLKRLGADIFKTIRDRSQVANAIDVVQGHILVLKGCMSHQCDNNNAITIFDMNNDKFHSLFQVNGLFYSVGDNLKDELMPMGGFNQSIYQHLYNDYLQEYKLSVDIGENGEVLIKH